MLHNISNDDVECTMKNNHDHNSDDCKQNVVQEIPHPNHYQSSQLHHRHTPLSSKKRKEDTEAAVAAAASVIQQQAKLHHPRHFSYDADDGKDHSVNNHNSIFLPAANNSNHNTALLQSSFSGGGASLNLKSTASPMQTSKVIAAATALSTIAPISSSGCDRSGIFRKQMLTRQCSFNNKNSVSQSINSSSSFMSAWNTGKLIKLTTCLVVVVYLVCMVGVLLYYQHPLPLEHQPQLQQLPRSSKKNVSNKQQYHIHNHENNSVHTNDISKDKKIDQYALHDKFNNDYYNANKQKLYSSLHEWKELQSRQADILIKKRQVKRRGFITSEHERLPFQEQKQIRQESSPEAAMIHLVNDPVTRTTQLSSAPLSNRSLKSEATPGLEEKKGDSSTNNSRSAFQYAKPSDLCGHHAQSAAAASAINKNPKFQKRDVLNSSSRVVITGILSNPVAFNLAITLGQECGVKEIIGFDHMMPNTDYERLRIQTLIGILTQVIPKLTQPLYISHVGLIPKTSSRKVVKIMNGMSEENIYPEFDLVTKFKPTHVVHLMNSDGGVPLSGKAGIFEGCSEDENDEDENSDFEAGCKNQKLPLNRWKQSMISMEQILKSIRDVADVDTDKIHTSSTSSTSSMPRRPHFVYASTGNIVGTDVQSNHKNSATRSETNNHDEVNANISNISAEIFKATKVIDEILASTYYKMYNVYSVGLRFGDVYGPWSRPGTDAFELTEQVRVQYLDYKTYATKRSGSQQQQPSSKNEQKLRHSSLKEWLFVDDAVNAMIVAMQYRHGELTSLTPDPVESSIVFDIQSGSKASSSKTTLAKMGQIMKEHISNSSKTVSERSIIHSPKAASNFLDIVTPAVPKDSTARTELHWSSETSMHDGIGKTLAWHLERSQPFGLSSLVLSKPQQHQMQPHDEFKVNNLNDIAAHDVTSSNNNIIFHNYTTTMTQKESIIDKGNRIIQLFGTPTCANTITTISKYSKMKNIYEKQQPRQRSQLRSSSTAASTTSNCFRGIDPFPCASECSSSFSHEQQQQGKGGGYCSPSIFDSIVELSRQVTANCDVVLYTHRLDDMKKQNNDDKQDNDSENDEMMLPAANTPTKHIRDKRRLCNIAYVAQNSSLTNDILDEYIQNNHNREGNSDISESDNIGIDKRTLLQALNGKLEVDGWTTIWIPPPPPSTFSSFKTKQQQLGDTEQILISPFEENLLKLSPGKLFAPMVQYAMFIDKTITAAPSTDDVLFLVNEMHRNAIRERKKTIKVTQTVTKMAQPQQKDKDGQEIISEEEEEEEETEEIKHKLIIPAEPERDAVLMIPKLKFASTETYTEGEGESRNSKKQLSLSDAVRIMIRQLLKDTAEKGKSSASIIDEKEILEDRRLKKQREYYDRVSSFVNNDSSRSPFASEYQFAFNHWIRSKWIVHNFQLEEARQIRCDWYFEHSSWGNSFDQISFAYVMARREMRRRILHREMDDDARKSLPVYPKGMTDKDDWHEVMELDNEGEEDEIIQIDNKNNKAKRAKAGMYVRIVDDDALHLSRKKWIDENKQELDKFKKEQRQQQEEL